MRSFTFPQTIEIYNFLYMNISFKTYSATLSLKNLCIYNPTFAHCIPMQFPILNHILLLQICCTRGRTSIKSAHTAGRHILLKITTSKGGTSSGVV